VIESVGMVSTYSPTCCNARRTASRRRML
jgi:hypothetical protein